MKKRDYVHPPQLIIVGDFPNEDCNYLQYYNNLQTAINEAQSVALSSKPYTVVSYKPVEDYTAGGKIILNATDWIEANAQIFAPSVVTPQITNDGAITISADDGEISFSSATARYIFVEVPVFADNASAISGGLTVGTMYRTATGVSMIVYTP